MTFSHYDVLTDFFVLEIASFLLKCVVPAKELHFGTNLCAVSINDSGRKKWDYAVGWIPAHPQGFIRLSRAMGL